jgi:hypothetical protein
MTDIAPAHVKWEILVPHICNESKLGRPLPRAWRHESRRMVAEPLGYIFPHKRDLDGIYKSICPLCFKTVASGPKEDDLAATEAAHVCLGLDLNELRPIYKK